MDTQSAPQNPGISPDQHERISPMPASGQPEVTPRSEAGSEMPSSGGAGSVSEGAAPAVPATSAPVAQSVTPPPSSSQPKVSGPQTAADVDVIEPEWVDKAEEVIVKHQGDPYGEEEAVEDLQQDYLHKRYGHNVADANSDGSSPGVS